MVWDWTDQCSRIHNRNIGKSEEESYYVGVWINKFLFCHLNGLL